MIHLDLYYIILYQLFFSGPSESANIEHQLMESQAARAHSALQLSRRVQESSVALIPGAISFLTMLMSVPVHVSACRSHHPMSVHHTLPITHSLCKTKISIPFLPLDLPALNPLVSPPPAATRPRPPGVREAAGRCSHMAAILSRGRGSGL